MVPLEGVLIGLVQGLKHSVEPDHVAAITTLVSDSPRPLAAARTGAAWGLGHAAAIVLLGGILIALGVRMPARVAFVLDICVAATFIGLGFLALRVRPAKAGHAHHHHAEHSHPHPAARAENGGGRWRGRSTLVGFVHGAAGTGGITLICLTTIPSTTQALLFLFAFAAGATVSMSALSGLVAAPLGAVARRGEGFARAVRYAAAGLSFASAIIVALAAFYG